VGENAVKRMTIGGGSSSLKAKYEVSPLAGIQKRVGNSAKVTYLPGYASPAVKEQDVKNAKAPKQTKTDAETLRIEALNAAKDADVILFIGGLNKNNGQDCEGNDRKELDLPYGQNELITALSKVNPNTVVVVISGNAVTMPWVKNVPSIVEAWYGGTETGNALASVLFGDVNPSGKLPFTFPIRLEDNAAHALGEYPGDSVNVTYKESIFVGYRWADMQKKAKPLFAFGHGLSYTTFEYGKPIADKKKISLDETVTFTVKVRNTGTREGQEVVQLYISDKKSSLPRPVKELKGFKKVKLAPGEEKEVSFTVCKAALSFYDDTKGQWVAEPGKFEAIIAASATDIKGIIEFELI
jgi:beta-glucosidase